MEACLKEHPEFIDVTVDSWTPVNRGVIPEHEATMELLLHGSQARDALSKDGYTPLH